MHQLHTVRKLDSHFERRRFALKMPKEVMSHVEAFRKYFGKRNNLCDFTQLLYNIGLGFWDFFRNLRRLSMYINT